MSLIFPVRRDSVFMIPEAKFRTQSRPTHGGVDFTPVKQGATEDCYAVESGTIVISGYSSMAGNNVMILTPSGRRWWYGHLSHRSVSHGQWVSAGQVIGKMGNTGNSFGVHLHLELHYPQINVEVDPWMFIFNAPDVSGSIMSPAPSRERALETYPQFQPEPAPAPAPDAPAQPQKNFQEEDDMILVRNTKTGHVYTIGKQYIRHETHGPSAEYATKVLTVNDEYVQADPEQFSVILNSLGIPAEAATAVLRGKVWSPVTGVVDARTMSLNAF